MLQSPANRMYTCRVAKLVSIAEMKAIEKAADVSGLSYGRMMLNAGGALARSALAHSQLSKRSVVGLVGPGNNGGDTLVALGHLAKQGWTARALLVGNRHKDKQSKSAEQAGVKVAAYTPSAARRLLASSQVVLDGLLGTGIHLPLRSPFDEVLHLAGITLSGRPHPAYVIAVDCPSGLDCDSGQIAPEALFADLTVSMAAVKQGMLTLPAFAHLGKIEVGDIGLTADLPEWGAVQRYVIDEPMARAALPHRPPDSHKGTFGTALVIAGSRHFPGAALLAGEAAYRSGAGLVTIGTVQSMQPALAGHLREVVWLPLPDQDGWIAEAAADMALANLERVTAMLLGPGFGQQPQTGKFLERLLSGKLRPLVVDADGLKLLAQIPDWPKKLPAETVLTPHPGEMSVLTGVPIKEIQADRIEVAEKFAAAWTQVVVLKGAFSVVAAPDGQSAVLPLATAALARAGTGDVLAGIITGLRAQGVSAFEAACAGVWLHGQAGLAAEARLGSSAGILAGDLIRELPSLFATQHG